MTKSDGVQTLYSTIERLKYLHDTRMMSWAQIALLDEYSGISRATLCAIAHGREPKNEHTRAILHLPQYAPAPVCPRCGEVHTKKSCPRERVPWSQRPWRDIPAALLRWKLDNREEL